MSIGEFLGSTLASILGTVTYNAVEYYVKTGLPAPLFLHRRELSAAVKAMPFIYKDIDSEVTVDFVDIDVETLDPQRMTAIDAPISRTAAEKRLQVRNKILILGNAGIGKSTYVRHTILSLFAGKHPPFLFAREKPVPFYVPLKAVDNFAPAPIIRYVLDNSVYLRGRRGAARLLKLARDRRLILFLDGYDEISVDISGDRQNNFVRDELDVLIGKAAPGKLRASEGFTPLYLALAECRAWVTSRKEFYAQNPINLGKVYGSMAEPLDCVFLGLLGVGNARARLVRNIFDKYRTRSAKFRELLNEELFLQQVDRAPNEELSQLSTNPLFLTVMCYVYVHQVLECENPYIEWTSEDAAALVVRCMDILLRDLDEDKARGLPPAQRAALVRRRNAFEAEKRAFLPYFAWTVLSGRRNVFDVTFVNKQAREFFARGTFSNKDAIIRAIDKAPAGADSLGFQLANQGVFVTVGRLAGVMQYDFAHQRFKEVLAAKYVQAFLTADEICALIEREDMAEFVYVLAREGDMGPLVFNQVLYRAASGDRRMYFGRLASELVRMLQHDYEVRAAAARFLTDAVQFDRDVRITRGFIAGATPTDDLLRAAEDAVVTGVRDDLRRPFTFGATVLKEHAPARLVALLEEHFVNIIQSAEISIDGIAWAYELNPAIVFGKFRIIRTSPRAFLETAYIVATMTSAVDDLPPTFATSIEDLPLRDLTLLFATIATVNPALFGTLGRFGWSSEKLESVIHLVRFAQNNSSAWASFTRANRPLLVVTRIAMGRATFEAEETRPLIGDVFAQRIEGDPPKSPAAPKRADAMTLVSGVDAAEIARGVAQESETRYDSRVPRRKDMHFLLK